MHELQEKLERVSRLCHAHRLGGVVLTTQANFAWITGGRSNRIDGTRASGAGALLITANGQRLVLANAIEMPRLRDEALAGIPCEEIEYPWVDDHIEPGVLVRLARQVTSTSLPIGTDWPIEGAVTIDRAIVEARALLTPAEIERYCALGRDVGEVAGTLCHDLDPGVSESEIARRAADTVAAVGARATVILVAADHRIARYRHAPPTNIRWQQIVMLVLCAEREGLVVALTRLVSAGPIPAELGVRTRAAAAVFGRLLEATRVDRTGRCLYEEAVRAYADAGYPGEEVRHHQGGAIGYEARDWLAHPASDDRVMARQAFAWNPSITGTKVEETALLIDDRMEIITGSPGWPSMEMTIRGGILRAPLVLVRD